MDKLIKAINSLKNFYTPPISTSDKPSKEPVSATGKERQNDCKTIVDCITSNNIKSHPDFNGLLSVSIETLLQVCSDEDANVRMSADECLNRVCNDMQEAHIGKLVLEFYKEIKRNGASRSVRAAIIRFASLCHKIRPNKCRPFIINLLPALSDVLKREDEIIHECLPQSLMMIFKVLRVFINDQELRDFMNVLMENLFNSSSTIRRTSASVLQATVKYAVKPQLSMKKLTNELIGHLKSHRQDKSVILGVLTCLRHMLLVLSSELCDTKESSVNHEVRMIFEVCVYHCLIQDNMIVTAALETLQTLLELPPIFIASWVSSEDAFHMSTAGYFVKNPQGNLPDIVADIDPSHAKDSGDSQANDAMAQGAGEMFKEAETELQSFNFHNKANIEATKFLTSRFLLSSTTGMLIEDSKVRVSTKALALSCVSSLAKIDPCVMSIKLSEELDQQISDVLLYAKHLDPRMRGISAGVAANVITSTLIKARDPSSKANLLDPLSSIPDCCQIITDCLFDESNTAVKDGVAAISACANLLLNSEFYKLAVDMLLKLLSILPNAYWLTKMDSIEVISNIDFYVMAYHESKSKNEKLHKDCKQIKNLQQMILNEVLNSLSHEDARVRNIAANKLSHLAKTLYFPKSKHTVDIVTMRMYMQSCDMFRSASASGQHGAPTVSQRYHRITDKNIPINSTVVDNLSFIISQISDKLFHSPTKACFHGCLNALTNMSNVFPIAQYSAAWNCGVVAQTKDPVNVEKKMGLLPLLLCYLNSAWLSSDLAIHSSLVILIGNFLTGLVVLVLRSKEDTPKEAVPLGQEADVPSIVGEILSSHVKDFFKHLSQVLCMFHHAITGQSPTLSKPVLPSISAPSISSPIKKKDKTPRSNTSTPNLVGKEIAGSQKPQATKEETDKEKNKTFTYASFIHVPGKLKLFELVKSTYDIYKTTVNTDDSDRFLQFVTSVLDSYCQILEVLSFSEVSGQIEEIIQFINTVFKVQPTMAVLCIEQLLKALFGNNLLSAWESKEKRDQQQKDNDNVGPNVLMQKPSFYHYAFQYPLNQLTMTVANASFHHYLQVEGQQKPTKGWFVSMKKKMEKKLSLSTKGSNNEASSVQSYIRLFESIVIRSLKTYTITASVEVQIHVLNLLSQLVQLRVNYCLLDADQIFIGFIIKQFELIESGQISKSEELVPNIFFFLVLLSYECYHSKTVITMPSIIQLCDRIMASGRNSFTHAVPALRPLIHDLFVARGQGKQETNTLLMTQQEVVQSMLLRILQFPQVIKMVTAVLQHYRREDTNRWKKFSRQVTDLILPMLTKFQMQVSSMEDIELLHCLFEALSPIALRPVDLLLTVMLTVPTDLSTASLNQQWLVKMLVLHRVLLYHFKENVVLDRIAQLGVNINQMQCSNLMKLSGIENESISDELCGTSDKMEESNLLARTWLQAVGYTCHRVANELSNSTTSWSQQDINFLVQLLSESFLVLTYTIKSGTYSNFSKSIQHLLQWRSSFNMDGFFSSSEITARFLQLSSEHPVVTMLWMQLLKQCNNYGKEMWSQMNDFMKNFNDKRDGSFCNINLNAVQYGSLVLYAEKFTQDISDIEFASIILDISVNDILSLHNEPPVQDFMAVMKENTKICNKLQDKISSVIADPTIQMDLKLRSILHYFSCYGSSNTELSFLLQFFNNLLRSNAPAFTLKFTAKLLGNKISIFMQTTRAGEMGDRDERIKELEASLKLKKTEKHFKMLGESLDKLKQHLKIEDEKRTMTMTEKLPNESWYKDVVKQLGGSTCMSLSKFGEILAVLDNDTIQNIFMDEDVLHLHMRGSIKYAVKESTENPPDTRLLKSLTNVIRRLITSDIPCFSEFSTEKKYNLSSDLSAILESKLMDNLQLSTLMRHCEIMINYFKYYDVIENHCQLTSDELKQSFLLLVTYGKGLESLMRQTGNISVSYCTVFLKMLVCLFPLCTDMLNRDQDWIIFSCAGSLIAILEHYSTKIEYKITLPSDCTEKMSHINRVILNKMIHLINILSSTENGLNNLPPNMDATLIDAAWQICRSEVFNSFVRVPSLIWKMGWNPDVVWPHLPEPSGQYLQEKDVLADYVSRINFLGYKSRMQFEETWTNLLSVLVSQPVAESFETGKTPHDEEIELSCLAIKGLTSLVLKTSEQNKFKWNSVISQQCNIKVKHLQAGRQMLLLQNILQLEIQDSVTRDFPHSISHRFHDPWKGINFLTNNNFTKWIELKSEYINSHQTQYEVGQLPLSHFQDVLGLNTDESNDSIADVFEEECSTVEKPNMKNKVREEMEIDVHSCVQFLVDLYTDWFRIIKHPNQQTGEAQPVLNVPRQLLCECFRSILLISDFFTERRQFEWMFSSLSYFLGNLEMDDEIILQYLVISLSKSGAVLGLELHVFDVVSNVIQTALSSSLSSCQVCALHATLYLTQCEPQTYMQPLITAVHSFVRKILKEIREMSVQNIEFIRLTLSLAFQMIEKWNSFFPHDFIEDVVQTCLSVFSEVSSSDGVLEVSVCHGLQRLVLTMSLNRAQCHVLSKLMARKIQHDSPSAQMNLMVALLLTCMYNERLRSTDQDETDIEKAVEMKLIMMEHITTLLSRIREGIPEDCFVICKILPLLLDHFFTPQDVLNKVIGEFASSRQPFPNLMAKVLFEVFQLLHSRDQGGFVSEWVMLSLANFAQRTPLSTAVWSLTCLFICSSTNPWLKPLLPFVPTSTESIFCSQRQIEFLCMAAADFFFNQLTEEFDRRSFQSTFQSFADSNESPYSKLLSHLGINMNNKDLLA